MKQLSFEGFSRPEGWYLIDETSQWSVLGVFNSLGGAVGGAAVVFSDHLVSGFGQEQIRLTIGRTEPDLLIFAYSEEARYPDYVLTQEPAKG